MQIQKHMTKDPVTVNSHQTLKYALETMKEHNFRHLPVLEQGRVTGVLSERDIRFVESFEKLSLDELIVSDAYSDDLISFPPTADIKEVCKVMQENKIGSVIIQQDKELLGIFTWIDALRYISQ